MKLYFTAKKNRFLKEHLKEPALGISFEANKMFKGFDVDLIEYAFTAAPYGFAALAYHNFSQGNTGFGFLCLTLPALDIFTRCAKTHPESNVKKAPKIK